MEFTTYRSNNSSAPLDMPVSFAGLAVCQVVPEAHSQSNAPEGLATPIHESTGAWITAELTRLELSTALVVQGLAPHTSVGPRHRLLTLAHDRGCIVEWQTSIAALEYLWRHITPAWQLSQPNALIATAHKCATSLATACYYLLQGVRKVEKLFATERAYPEPITISLECIIKTLTMYIRWRTLAYAPVNQASQRLVARLALWASASRQVAHPLKKFATLARSLAEFEDSLVLAALPTHWLDTTEIQAIAKHISLARQDLTDREEAAHLLSAPLLTTNGLLVQAVKRSELQTGWEVVMDLTPVIEALRQAQFSWVTKHFSESSMARKAECTAPVSRSVRVSVGWTAIKDGQTTSATLIVCTRSIYYQTSQETFERNSSHTLLLPIEAHCNYHIGQVLSMRQMKKLSLELWIIEHIVHSRHQIKVGIRKLFEKFHLEYLRSQDRMWPGTDSQKIEAIVSAPSRRRSRYGFSTALLPIPNTGSLDLKSLPLHVVTELGRFAQIENSRISHGTLIVNLVYGISSDSTLLDPPQTEPPRESWRPVGLSQTSTVET